MQVGKRSQRGCCFNLSQTIQPYGQVGLDAPLHMLETKGKEQIPWTDHIAQEVDEGVGLDADPIEDPGDLANQC